MTLLELLIVLTIMGIVAAVSVPALILDDSAPTDAFTAIQRLAAIARATAITDARVVRIRFDVTTARYWIREENVGGDTLLTSGALLLGPGERLVAIHPRTELRYVPDGRATGDLPAVRSVDGSTRMPALAR